MTSFFPTPKPAKDTKGLGTGGDYDLFAEQFKPGDVGYEAGLAFSRYIQLGHTIMRALIAEDRDAVVEADKALNKALTEAGVVDQWERAALSSMIIAASMQIGKP